MSGDPTKLSQPPKLGPKTPGPSTLADWVSFWRWLVNLWQVASSAVNAPEAITIAPRGLPQGSDQNTLGEAQVFTAARPEPNRTREPDAAATQALSLYTPLRTNPPDELTTLMQLALSKVPYPLRKDATAVPAIEDVHAARITSGTCTIVGVTITRIPGPGAGVFQTFMVGRLIEINYILYRVMTYIDPNNLTVASAPPAGPGLYRYTSYPSVAYPLGTFFYETDRTVLYLNANATGVVNTAGTTVNWVSGDLFDGYWKQARILISGVSYEIAAVVSGVQLTLVSSAGVQAGAIYTVVAGEWIYVAGEFFETLANRPRDLGIYDDGFLFNCWDFGHLFRWNRLVPGYQFAPSDNGSGYIVAGTPTNAPLFLPCDGSVITIAASDATTVSVTTPNLTGDVFLKGAAAQGAQQVATVPTWQGGAKTDDGTSVFSAGAKTEDESAHTHAVDVNSSDGGATGSDFDFAHPGTYTSGPGSAHHHDVNNVDAPQDPHHHDLSNANAKLNTPSEANGGLPLRIALKWYMRI